MKRQLRCQMLKKLKTQNERQKALADQRLVERLLRRDAYQNAKTLATYLSFEYEFKTSLLIEQALRDGKRVCVPKTYPKGRMVFMDYQKEQLEKTAFGLLEPKETAQIVRKEDIDLIHVPGLVFDPKGYRIGYGGGYYDRYLADFHGKTISTIYAFQRGLFDVQKEDIPIQEVIVDDSIL